ncbi:MAG: FAD-dependent oxidoreductase [Desulfarculaceae bacterium]|nr:FAD-dependent oxidoreductase [Desulfarculaceae bacterium]
MGDFTVSLVKKPRYVIEDACTGCTSCVEYCPVEYPDKFNQGISDNKAVHIYFAQAIPLIAYIDESCIYLKEKKCRICENVCQANAIDFHQKPEKLQIRVGAVVLSPGYEVYDPAVKEEYGYGRIPNVVTSMDYERLLCATGPYEGEILRASDKKHPQNVAWLQCIGSRRLTEGDNSYCSSVCCTYTQKQVILTKDHHADAKCTVFHNDVRAYGKDFERYYQNTAALADTRFIRSYVNIVGENPENHNVIIRYSTPDEGVKEEEFDMVVLSVGLNPPEDNQRLAEMFGLELDQHGFCKGEPFNPMNTGAPGVFVSGAFQGPMDIPESVFSASAAGSQTGELLDYRRDKLTKEREYPSEKDVTGEEPRIGVFVCHCGANIGRIVDVPGTVEFAKTLPNVVYAQEQLFSCATNSAKEITDMIKEKGLNRVVVAACSPRTLEPLFRDTLREAGLNQYYYDMANIREHCSWCHSKEREASTAKAQDITRMSVARACLLEPLSEIDLPVNKAALVVGGGIAGMTAALSIAEQGHEVYLLEKSNELGGLAVRIHDTLDGLDVPAYLEELKAKVFKHPLLHVYTGAEITEATGYVGNFVTKVKSWRGLVEIKHGVTVVATGSGVYEPNEYLYGQDERVMTHLELEERITNGDEGLAEAETVVMIQCVGCRNEERNYCSRVCCGESVKNAIKLKKQNPERDVYILYRDMRTYGYMEDHYREANELGVRFVRYEPEQAPQVEAAESDEGKPVLRVSLPDYILSTEIAIDADYVMLAAAVVPGEDNVELSGLFGAALGEDGFFKEAHVKLRPVEFATQGVYLCGAAHYPKYIHETINQAYGAAGRALTMLSNDIVTVSGSVCEVKEDACMGCRACLEACSYDAIEMRKTKGGPKAVVNPVLCKGDGLCNACCPTGAIYLKHFTDEEVFSQIDAYAPPDEDILGQIDAAVNQ